MWGRIFTWIATNLALPIFWEFVKRYTEKPKIIESAPAGELETKLQAKIKEDGFNVP